MKKYANMDCMCDCEVKREYSQREMDAYDAQRDHESEKSAEREECDEQG